MSYNYLIRKIELKPFFIYRNCIFLKKQGCHYSGAMVRSILTHTPECSQEKSVITWIVLKLFNLVKTKGGGCKTLPWVWIGLIKQNCDYCFIVTRENLLIIPKVRPWCSKVLIKIKCTNVISINQIERLMYKPTCAKPFFGICIKQSERKIIIMI